MLHLLPAQQWKLQSLDGILAPISTGLSFPRDVFVSPRNRPNLV
jgi:hypothetical protein